MIAWIGATHACADDQSQSSSALEQAIREIRGVHGVIAAFSQNPSKGCVMHLLDMHYVSWDQFVAGSKARDADAVARDIEALRVQYEWITHECQALQLEHENIIRDITTGFGTAVVYVEGLAADDRATKEFLIAVRGGERHLHEVARTVPRVNDFLKRFEATKPGDLNSTDYFKLRCGAAGSLFLSGKLSTIEPVEGSTAFNVHARLLGRPLYWTDPGQLYLTDAKEAREDAIVSTLLKGQMP
ncbi:MAG TPA: hypothetical protein VG125_20105, partial [Pirellulales bacterium]|nr:hypothetical protein [Pirellulales bacterium]